MTGVVQRRPAAGQLPALVASRICHDLIGPLGAIANGLELLALAGVAGEEADLIGESVANATARLRFFRVAFGVAGESQGISRAEVASTLAAVSRAGRVSFEWQAAEDLPRAEARAAFLLLLCLETAMPHGGQVTVRREGAALALTGEGPRMKVEEPLWLAMQASEAAPPEAPALVHFAVLPALLLELARPLALELAPRRIVARF